MKNVRVIFLVCIVLCAASLANGQTVSKCFRADWLQGERVVKLTINGSEVSGTFTVGGGDATGDTAYNFSGTRRGNVLNVAFAGNKLPDVAPSEMKSLAWTLLKRGDKESLRIKFSGKNYETNKYEESLADFESCDGSSGKAGAGSAGAGYADLVKTAQTVRFARGATSASVRLDSLVEFQAMRAPATFLVNAAKSQSLDVKADGCTVEVYLPDGKHYEYVEWESGSERTFAGSQIDMMQIKALPATGNYLIVLRKPSEAMRPDVLTVSVTRKR
ncbi:MAG: hypothetical protein WCD76_01210 [Pyrinomonadaceae bacterium]